MATINLDNLIISKDTSPDISSIQGIILLYNRNL